MFIGFSTKKLIEAVKRKKKRIDHIIVIEPDPTIFKHVLMTEDLTEYIQNPHYEFLVGLRPDEIMPELFRCLTKIDKDSVTSRVTKMHSMERIIDPFTYKDRNDQVAKDIDEAINVTVKQIQLSMGCSSDQQIRWEMMIENREVMYNSWNAKEQFGKFEGKTAIVCGGGPSLQEFIDHYKANTEAMSGCLIIAADAVLKRLLDEGIKPHMVTRCERKKTHIFKGVDKSMTQDIYYCGYPWTDKSFFDLFDNHFYLFRNNGVCLFTQFSHGLVDGGVSAANAAMELAHNLGASRIIMTGVDLCFVDGKSHVGGTMVEFDIERSRDKWSKTKNNSDEEVTTIPVWLRCYNEYIQGVEKHKHKGKNVEVVTTATKGIKFPNIKFVPWKDLAFDGSGQKPLEIIKANLKKCPPEEKEKFISFMRTALSDLKEISDACDIAWNLEDDARRVCDREIEQIYLRIHAELKGKHPWEIIKGLRGNQNNYDKLWKNVAEQYDLNFKTKYLPNINYRIIMMDVLQLDMFHYENRINGLANMKEFNCDKYEEYARLTRDFLVQIKLMAGRFIKLFESAL